MISHDWHFANNDGAMNKHLQQCPYKVQCYDSTKLWHCTPNFKTDDETLWLQIPMSSVDFNKLRHQ